MVRFAVDVAGDAAPHRDELGARRDHRKPAARGEVFDDLGQADAGFTHEGAGLIVESEVAIDLGHGDDLAMAVERGVAIATAQTARDAGAPVENGRQITRKFGADQRAVSAHVGAPPR